MRSERLLKALILAALLEISVEAQNHISFQQAEQTSFGSDVIPGQVRIKRPIGIPQGALEALRNTRRVLTCLEAEGMTPEQVPASWFVGSEIHLNGPNEVDLIVQPQDLTEKPPANRCLLGAHVGPFWILRNNGPKYELLLETNADGLLVLQAKTKGYRDIKALTGLVTKVASTRFRFDGQKYRPSTHRE